MRDWEPLAETRPDKRGAVQGLARDSREPRAVEPVAWRARRPQWLLGNRVEEGHAVEGVRSGSAAASGAQSMTAAATRAGDATRGAGAAVSKAVLLAAAHATATAAADTAAGAAAADTEVVARSCAHDNVHGEEPQSTLVCLEQVELQDLGKVGRDQTAHSLRDEVPHHPAEKRDPVHFIGTLWREKGT